MTIKKLKRSDEGRYCCGMEKPFNVLYQEVNLIVLDGEFLFNVVQVMGLFGIKIYKACIQDKIHILLKTKKCQLQLTVREYFQFCF